MASEPGLAFAPDENVRALRAPTGLVNVHQLPNAGAGVDFRQNADRRRAIATSAALIAALAADIGVASDGGDCPPNPEPGKCYEKVYSPAQYEDQAEQVLDQPARVETRTIAAVYRLEERRIPVGAPGRDPGDQGYRTVVESVLVAPARVERYTAPATYKIVMSRHKVRDASFTWRVVACGPGRMPPRAGG